MDKVDGPRRAAGAVGGGGGAAHCRILFSGKMTHVFVVGAGCGFL